MGGAFVACLHSERQWKTDDGVRTYGKIGAEPDPVIAADELANLIATFQSRRFRKSRDLLIKTPAIFDTLVWDLRKPPQWVLDEGLGRALPKSVEAAVATRQSIAPEANVTA